MTRLLRRGWARPVTVIALPLAAITLLHGGPSRGSAHGAPRLIGRFKVEVDVRGDIRQSSVIEVVMRAQALRTSPHSQARLAFPAGFTVLSGPTEWSGPMAERQSITLTARIRLDSLGVHQITGTVSDTTEQGDPNVSTEGYSGLYLAIGKKAGFADKTLNGRFVAPARRALPKLIAGSEEVPVVPTGGTVYLRTDGPARPSRELRRALASIDSLGVEALFEDSTAQVGRLRRAISLDRGSSLAPEDAAPPPASLRLPGAEAAAAVSCPAGYWGRTGYVQYVDNNGVNQRLPNVLIYAANVPHGFGGGLAVAFRSESDGSFNECFPVTVEGYTIITVYQDIGGVYVHRDDPPDPRHVFPQWWDAVWDLAHSATIPINTRHPEVSFALATWNKALNASYTIFTATRSPVRAWYFSNADTDYYCPISFFLPNCTKVGEGIYFHKFASDGSTSGIWSPYGQFGKAHEYGHAWDNAILGHIGGSCTGTSHSLDLPNSLGCAVREGWADFFAAITLPTTYVNGEVIRFGSGPRGPETELPVANYLFDLVDSPTFPSVRSPAAEDDPVTVDPNYLVRVLRDGRTNVFSPPSLLKSVQEIIAIVDDVTPIPSKSQFSAYVQPTALATRVARPGSITVAQNRALWLKNIFNIVEPPPPPPPAFIVTAGAPGSVTVKKTYSLTGSASQPATAWRWDRDDDGTAYTLWANAQNSSFIAYAGSYTINWRLFARRTSDAVTDYGFASTVVCITSSPCSPPALVANAELRSVPSAGPSAVSAAARAPASRPASHSPVAGHYGAGPWISRDADSVAVQFYSLSGMHEGTDAPGTWPNSFGLPDGAPARHTGRGPRAPSR